MVHLYKKINWLIDLQNVSSIHYNQIVCIKLKCENIIFNVYVHFPYVSKAGIQSAFRVFSVCLQTFLGTIYGTGIGPRHGNSSKVKYSLKMF